MIPLVAINQLAAVYRGRGKNEAYLEFAQEHFLDWLRAEHVFEDGAVVFKGGTAIRKFVLGNEGRFSLLVRDGVGLVSASRDVDIGVLAAVAVVQ